jgi:glycyl-tRNA synthetase alpha subunit
MLAKRVTIWEAAVIARAAVWGLEWAVWVARAEVAAQAVAQAVVQVAAQAVVQAVVAQVVVAAVAAQVVAVVVAAANNTNSAFLSD